MIDAWHRLRLPVRQGIWFPIMGFAIVGFFMLVGINDDPWDLVWIPLLLGVAGVANGLLTERRHRTREAAQSAAPEPEADGS